MAQITEDRSLGDLFAELSRETSTLVRKEVQLAKTEMTEKATKAGRNIGFLVAGGAVAYAGLLALIAALIVGLAEFVGLFLSALIVGLVVAVIGYFLVQKGLDALKHMDLTPQQTIDTLKEDKEWLQEQTQ